MYSTPATEELAELLLLDAAHNQEEDADVCQSQGVFQASPGLAAVRRRRRAAGDAAVSHGAARRVVFAGRAHLVPLPRRRPSAGLVHDRSRDSRRRQAVATVVLGRRGTLRRAAVLRSANAAGLRLFDLREHLWRPGASAGQRTRPVVRGGAGGDRARRRDARGVVRRRAGAAVDLPAANPDRDEADSADPDFSRQPDGRQPA